MAFGRCPATCWQAGRLLGNLLIIRNKLGWYLPSNKTCVFAAPFRGSCLNYLGTYTRDKFNLIYLATGDVIFVNIGMQPVGRYPIFC